MSDHIYYNFSITNDTSNTIIADKTDRRLNALLSNPSEYVLGVVKFSLPTEAIKSFIISNNSDYIVKYGCTAAFPPINPNLNPDILYNFFSAQNSLPSNDNFNYISYDDFIEAFNRTSLATYRDYLLFLNFVYGNRLVFTNTFNFAVNNTPYVFEQSIPVSTVITTVDNRLGYIKLSLNVGYTGALTGKRHPHRLYLVDPAGNRCLVYANLDCSYNNTMIFEDAALNNLDSISDYSQPIPSGTYQPKESFLKFNTTLSQFGTWKLRFETTSIEFPGSLNPIFNLSVNYNLEMFFMPIQANGNSIGVSQYPVLLGLSDNNTNLLQLKIHESWYYSSNFISFSPKLNSILGFPTYLSSDGLYKLKQPQVLLSQNVTAGSFIDYVQPVSTLYKLTNIKAIQLRSNTLPVSGEYSLASQSNIVMSIDTSVDSAKDVYEYSASIERYYDLIGNAELTDINFSIWVEYVNGEVVQCYLPPYSAFTMLCKFVNKNKIYN